MYRLRDDIKLQAEQIVNLQQKVRETQVSLADAQGKELPMQYDLMKCQRENENITSRLNYAEAELTAKTNELQNLRHETSTVSSNLRSKISALTAELKSVEERWKASQVSFIMCGVGMVNLCPIFLFVYFTRVGFLLTVYVTSVGFK